MAPITGSLLSPWPRTLTTPGATKQQIPEKDPGGHAVSPSVLILNQDNECPRREETSQGHLQAQWPLALLSPLGFPCPSPSPLP